MVKKNYDNMLSRFHRIPERNGRTARSAISISRVSMLTRDKDWRFSTNISLYFENATRYGHSYDVKRTGTSMQSIEWWHF